MFFHNFSWQINYRRFINGSTHNLFNNKVALKHTYEECVLIAVMLIEGNID